MILLHYFVWELEYEPEFLPLAKMLALNEGVPSFTICAVRTAQCVGSMFTSQPNKLRHILKFVFWYTI